MSGLTRIEMGDVGGNLTVVGDGWQLDVFQESAPLRPPVEATDVHVIVRGGEGGTASGRGRDGYVVVFTETGDGPQADLPKVHVHNAPGGGGEPRRLPPGEVQVTVGRGGAGGATPGADGQAGQTTGPPVGGAGGRGGGVA